MIISLCSSYTTSYGNKRILSTWWRSDNIALKEKKLLMYWKTRGIYALDTLMYKQNIEREGRKEIYWICGSLQRDMITPLSCPAIMQWRLDKQIRQADSDQILSKDQTRKKLHMKRHHTSLFSANSQHKPWEHNFRTILDVTSTGGGNLKTKATLKSE